MFYDDEAKRMSRFVRCICAFARRGGPGTLNSGNLCPVLMRFFVGNLSDRLNSTEQ